MNKKIFFGVLIFTLTVWLGVGMYFLTTVEKDRKTKAVPLPTMVSQPRVTSSPNPSKVKSLFTIEPEWCVIMGKAEKIEEGKITLLKDGKRASYYFAPDVQSFQILGGGEYKEISLSEIQLRKNTQLLVVREEKDTYSVQKIYVFP